VSNVQWRTPDNGQRNCPKPVEFLDKNKFVEIIAIVGFIKKKFVTMHGHMNLKFTELPLQ
jgi:CTP:phosphocholine cytidylyltransferase-like protein